MLFKLLLFLLAFLVGGAIINVAVACGCALWSTVTPGMTAEASEQDILEWKRLSDWQGAPDLTTTQPNSASHIVIHIHHDGGAGYEVRTLSAVTIIHSVRLRWRAQHGMIVRAGWPCRSLIGERSEAESGWDRYVPSVLVGANILTPPKHEQERHVLSIIRPAALGKASFRIFPLRPVVPGFAINTILYAGILWMLFGFPFAIRRRIRIKRNQCAACGYSLRGRSASEGDKCPECGMLSPQRGAGM